jgi:hypothetical protein
VSVYQECILNTSLKDAGDLQMPLSVEARSLSLSPSLSHLGKIPNVRFQCLGTDLKVNFKSAK